MSESTLTPEAREAIRSFIYKITIPFTAFLAIFTGIVGFTIKDYTVSEAVKLSQKEFLSSLTDVTKETATIQSNAEEILKDLNEKKQEIEELSRLLEEYRDNARSLASDHQFARQVAEIIEVNNIFKWRKIEYQPRGSFENNCMYILRENYYLEAADEPGYIYGPDLRTTIVAHHISKLYIEFFDKDNKLQKLSYFDLKDQQTSQASRVASPYIAYEACFTEKSKVKFKIDEGPDFR